MVPAARPPGPRLRTSLAVIGVGIAIGIASVVAIVLPLIGTFTSPVYSTAQDIHVHLHHARYTVYQRTGTRSGFRSSTLDPPATPIDPGSLTVLTPHGLSVPVAFDPDTETLTRGSSIYSGTLVFHAPVAGEYELRFANTNPTTVVVARSLGDALRAVAAWFGAGALGALLLVTGVVMWIVGATRRGRAKRAMYAAWGPPGLPGGPAQWGQPQWGQPQWGQPQWGPPGSAPPPPGYPPGPAASPPGAPPPKS